MSNETFLVTIKVELDDGTSREQKFRLHQDNIIHLELWQDIEKMHSQLLEPNPFI